MSIQNEKQNEKVSIWAWVIILFIAIIIVLVAIHYASNSRSSMITQIYPNYNFPKRGVNQIRVPLIPVQRLNPLSPRLPIEAGGWVTTPIGSACQVNYEVPVVIEYIDGRVVYREPNKPAWDGIKRCSKQLKNRLTEASFRVYGNGGGYAVITVERGIY